MVGLAGAIALAAAAAMVFVLRRLQAAAWAGRLPGRIGALPVVEVGPEEVPRGWKVAQVLLGPEGQVRLAGVAIGGSYAVEDRAVCVLGRRHTPPALTCECGFYAFRDRERALDLMARRMGWDHTIVVRVMLEVDLTGTVIECEYGYRAEQQRVLELRILPWCADCAAAGRLVPAAALAAATPPAPHPQDGHGQLAGLFRPHPSTRERLEWTPLRPVCDGCGDACLVEGEVLTLLELANRLGTEVGWLDPDLVPADRVLAAHRPPLRWPG